MGFLEGYCSPDPAGGVFSIPQLLLEGFPEASKPVEGWKFRANISMQYFHAICKGLREKFKFWRMQERCLSRRAFYTIRAHVKRTPTCISTIVPPNHSEVGCATYVRTKEFCAMSSASRAWRRQTPFGRARKALHRRFSFRSPVANPIVSGR